jgi:hypothetical protein
VGSQTGTPCVPDDESHPEFSAFQSGEVVIGEDDECGPREFCIVNHYQGRVSCPEGQTEEQAASNPVCTLVGSNDPVTVAVPPELADRPAVDAVYCSCRCDGPPGVTDSCTCPTGFVCTPLIEQVAGMTDDYAGSYCVKSSAPAP